jgi:O-antigen ligase
VALYDEPSTKNIGAALHRCPTIIVTVYYLLPFMLIVNWYSDSLFTEKDLYLGYIVICFGIILTMLLLFVQPLNYNSTRPNFFYWSHVGLGKYIAFSVIVNYIIVKSISLEKYRRLLLYSSLAILYAGLIVVGLRSALYGVNVVIALSVLLDLVYYKQIQKHMVIVFMVILLSHVTIYSFHDTFSRQIKRYETVQSFSYSDYRSDPAIGARLHAWDQSIQIIKENPLFGLGLGGYRSVDEFSKKMQYPHNMFLEVGGELGLIGFIILLWYLFGGLKQLFVRNHSVFVFAVFYVWISCFTGGLPDQKMLFVLLGIYAGKS